MNYTEIDHNPQFYIYKNISDQHACLLVKEIHSHFHHYDKRRSFF